MRNKITIFCFFTKIRQVTPALPRLYMPLLGETRAPQKTAGRHAKTCRKVCGGCRFAPYSGVWYAFCVYVIQKNVPFFCKNRTMLRACFCRLRLCGQFRQGKRRPNGGALWRPNKNRAEHSPCTAFCLLSALPRLKSRRLRGCPRRRRTRAGYLSRESQRL